MTGAALQVSYSDAEVRAAMTRLVEFPGTRGNALLGAIGGIGVSSTQLRFDTETTPVGSKWKPSQRVIKKGGKTLQLHGYLLGSMTYNVVGQAEGVEWGSPMIYAAAMQNGASIHSYARSQQIYRKVTGGGIEAQFVKKRKSNFAQRITIGDHTINIPSRPYLGINADDQVEIEDASARHLYAATMGISPGEVTQ